MSAACQLCVNSDLDIPAVRLQARKMAQHMGFPVADQARISLAASELARLLAWNVGQPGQIVIAPANQGARHGLQVTCRVRLPIAYTPPEVGQRLQPDLAGACRLADESTIQEQDAEHAQVTLVKWLGGSPRGAE